MTSCLQHNLKCIHLFGFPQPHPRHHHHSLRHLQIPLKGSPRFHFYLIATHQSSWSSRHGLFQVCQVMSFPLLEPSTPFHYFLNEIQIPQCGLWPPLWTGSSQTSPLPTFLSDWAAFLHSHALGHSFLQGLLPSLAGLSNPPCILAYFLDPSA